MSIFKKVKECNDNNDNTKVLLNKIEDISNKQKYIIKENEKLHRIIERYIPGEITWKSIDTFCFLGDGIFFGTYIYKDGKEYFINNLRLNKPTFEQCIYKDSIKIINKTKDSVFEEYIVNLLNSSITKTK